MEKLIFCDYWLWEKKLFYKDSDVIAGHIKRVDVPATPDEVARIKNLERPKAKIIIENVLNDLLVVLKSKEDIGWEKLEKDNLYINW